MAQLPSSSETMTDPRIDYVSFTTAVMIVLLVCVPLALLPEAGGEALKSLYNFIALNFGPAYLLAAIACIVFLLWLAFSRYGHVKLGSHDESPEFSTLSWVAMLFSAGVGAGLLFWCTTEWTYYYQAPPFGVAPRSTAAAEWAATYGLFHWGFSAWAFYCLPTIAIAYPYYSKKLPSLRFSTCCHAFIGNNPQGVVARFLDLLFMIALLGGAATSLGFSTPMIAEGFSQLINIEHTFTLEFFVVVLCVVLFAASVYAGLKKGIQRLSHLNLWLVFFLLLFVLLAGPTLFLIKTGVNSVGLMMQNFLRMSLWTEPFTKSGFVEDWTVFYWAWWVAYGPFVGLFVTRISRGRTLRQVILGMLVLGSLGSWLFYMILGNYGLFLELSETLKVTQVLNTDGADVAIFSILGQLPMAWVVIAVFCLVSLVFAATTYDSAAYTLASSATLGLTAGQEPTRMHRLFWAFALGIAPITLMYIGDLKVIQTAVLVVSLPLLVSGVVMSVSLMRSLRQAQNRDEQENAQAN